MITYTVSCPHCQQAEPVVKFGHTCSGTQRAKCKDCNKTFAINPKSKAVTPEKEALIERLIEETILPAYKRGEQPAVGLACLVVQDRADSELYHRSSL